MNDRIKEALDRSMTDMTWKEQNRQRVLYTVRQETLQTRTHKPALAIVLALVLVLFIATAIAGATNEDFNTWLYRIWPEAAKTLMPVNMSCTDAGIRMEVISAVVDGTDLYITYSMEDLEGDRLSTENSPVMYVTAEPDYMWEASFENPMRDEATGKIIFGEHFTYAGNLSKSVSVLKGHIPSFASSKETGRIDLFPYLEQYGSQVKTMPVPEDAVPLTWSDSYDQPSSGPISGPIPADMHVIDTGSSLEIPLADTVRLSGLGMVDGLLHVQLHYVNHQKKVFGEYLDTIVCRPDETVVMLLNRDSTSWYDLTYHNPDLLRNEIDLLGWGTQPGDPETPEWVEYIFTADASALSADQQEFFSTTHDIIPLQGSWDVEIPVRLIQNNP